ncbi:MAG TPA: hypothetical protein VFJ10_13445 [Acidobacteriaceae bacterium]|jgi:hypothetical protein|nr:hypothetical protein [Acidobacteriaceae bacterium]
MSGDLVIGVAVYSEPPSIAQMGDPGGERGASRALMLQTGTGPNFDSLSVQQSTAEDD